MRAVCPTMVVVRHPEVSAAGPGAEGLGGLCQLQRDLLCGRPCTGASWHRLSAQGSAFVPPYPGYRHAAPRRFTDRDRATAAPPSSEHDHDLRQGRCKRAAHAGIAVAGRWTMNTLREAVHDYLALRRGLGFKL